MPSDLVTITAAVAGPAVAGVAAVVIHRQRLAHERRESDLASTRKTLSDAARVGLRLIDSCHSTERSSEGIQRFEAELREWAVVHSSLRLFLGVEHDLVKAGRSVYSAAQEILEISTGDQPPSETADELERRREQVIAAINEWLRLGHRISGARLDV